MIKDAQDQINEKASEAPEPAAQKPSESEDRREAPIEEGEKIEPTTEEPKVAEPAPEAPVVNDDLAAMNAQLKNLLM